MADYKHIPEDLFKEIIERYEKGASVKELAPLAGVTPPTLAKKLFKAGVRLRKRGNKRGWKTKKAIKEGKLDSLGRRKKTPAIHITPSKPKEVIKEDRKVETEKPAPKRKVFKFE